MSGKLAYVNPNVLKRINDKCKTERRKEARRAKYHEKKRIAAYGSVWD